MRLSQKPPPSPPSLTELDLIDIELERRQFVTFARKAWRVVDPQHRFLSNWHIEAICDHCEAVAYGWISDVLINVPPGFAKSILVSVMFPAWVWLRDPGCQFLAGSHDVMKLGKRDSNRCRDLIESEWFQRRYIDTLEEKHKWALSEEQNEKLNYQNTRKGSRVTLGIGQGTGLRGDVHIYDDPSPVKPTKQQRADVKDWLSTTMPTRFNDPRRRRRIVIMQRVHEDDASQWALDAGFEHLCIPNEYIKAEQSITFIRRPVHTDGLLTPDCGQLDADGADPDALIPEVPESEVISAEQEQARHDPELFFEDPRIEDGELAFPRLFTKEVSAAKRKPEELGELEYAGQFQQKPAPASGDMFHDAWWRFWKPDGTAPEGKVKRPKGCNEDPAYPQPKKWDRVVISVDAAFKDLSSSDNVCMQVWGTHKAERFLLDVRLGKMGFAKSLAVLKQLIADWPEARAKLIEDKANGTAIIETLHKEVSGVIAVTPIGGKESRASAIQPYVQAGNIYLKDGAPWVPGFIAEAHGFPNGKHDDQVDAMSQGLLYMMPTTAAAKFAAMVKD